MTSDPDICPLTRGSLSKDRVNAQGRLAGAPRPDDKEAHPTAQRRQDVQALIECEATASAIQPPWSGERHKQPLLTPPNVDAHMYNDAHMKLNTHLEPSQEDTL